MRVLINALFLIPSRVGGSETYLRALVRALGRNEMENEYILCLGPEAADGFDLPGPGWRIVPSPAPSRNRPARLWLEQTWLPALARRIGVDVIHSAGYTSPLVSHSGRVTSIHDMNYRRHPEDMSALERFVYSILIPQAAQRSHRILTLTLAARSDIVRWTGVSDRKIDVVYAAPREWWPGAAAADIERLRAIRVAEPFVLGVAASYPHKNTRRLIDAFPICSPSGVSVHLIMTGHSGRAQQHIEAAAASKGRTVRLLGWVDDAVLASLYRRSIALAFPSLYEGFGLPIVEAMSLGTPVLTSNFGAMLEVADSAAELVDPHDIRSIKRGIERLINDGERREELRQLGRKRANEFSWDRTAAGTVAAYRAVSRQVGSAQ